MWTTLILCFLVAFGAAEKQHGAWRQETEYRYKVHTQTLAAIPNLKNQWVGLFTKADLTILPISKDRLIGKLHNAKYSEWHKSLPQGPGKFQPEDEQSYQPMEMNTKPFEIRLDEGAVHSIAVDKDMSNLELNQLKSIISQLQVDVHARNYIKSTHSHVPLNQEDGENTQAAYRVMEPTVTGKTETFYDISRIPLYMAQSYPESNIDIPLQKEERFYEIFKTKNYTNSEQRMGYHFGLDESNDWQPHHNLMGSLSKSAVSRIVITGSFDKFTIRSSVTTNRVVKANEEKEAQHDLTVVSQVNVTLASMEENTNKPQIESERLVDVGNLVYSYDMPSDKKNSMRPKKDSSEEENDEEGSAMYKAEDLLNELYSERSESRSRRSLNEREQSKENRRQHQNRNEYDITGLKKEYHQPKPTLREAPETPFASYFIGNKGRSIQNSKEFNAPKEVQKLAKEIAGDLQDVNEIPVKNTLRKFNILAKVIRTMSSKQIEETTDTFAQNDEKTSEKSRQVYRDALLSAGTGPAVNELMKWIEEGKIEGEKAAEVIAALPKNIREPTEEVQRRFFELVKHEAVRKQSNVDVAAGIAFTRFLHQAKVNKKAASKYYPVESYGRMSDDRDNEFVSEKVIPYFAQLLENAVRNKDAQKTLYAIRALGNLGHPMVANIFEPYLTGKERVSDFQRLAIVLALDKYIKTDERSGQTILFKLYQNKGETQEVRSAAAIQFLRTRPIAAVLQRMAEETNTEENEHVRAVVRSALESAARLETPENREFAENAKSALSLLKSETQGYQYSRTYLRDYVVREMDASYKQQSSYIVNQDSFIPNGLFSRTVGNLGGFKRYAEFQAVVSSVEELMNSISDEVSSWKSSSTRNEEDENEDSESGSSWSAGKIMKLLKMRANKSKQMEGQVLLNMFNSERFVAFDKSTIEQMPKIARKMAQKLRDGAEMKYMKLYNQHDVTISFPLETGLPFTYTFRAPALVQINGKMIARSHPDVASESERNIRMPESVNVSTEFDAVYSIATEVSVSFMNPSTRQLYVAGYDKKVQVNVPLQVSTDIDIRNREIKTEIKPLHDDKTMKLLQMGSWPYTTRQDIYKLRPYSESEHTKHVHSRPVRESTIRFGEKETGLDFVVKGSQEKDSNQLSNVFKQLRKHDLTSLLVFGQQSSSPEHYSLNVALDVPRSSSKSTKITIKYDRENKMDNGNQHQSHRSHPRARGQTADGSENLAIPSSTHPNSEERRQQFLRNAAEDMNASNGAVLDISLQFEGAKKHSYVATVSGASDKTEGKARILAFVQKSETESIKKGVYLHVDAKYQTVDELRQLNKRSNKPFADVRFKLSYALDNTVEVATVRGKVELKQTSELQKQLREQEQPRSADETPAVHSNTVDHVDVELDIKELPVEAMQSEIGLRPANVYNYIRYSTLLYLSENYDYKGEKDKISFEMRLAPDMRSANVTLKTPKMKTEWKGVRVPKVTKSIMVVPTSWNWLVEMKRESIQGRDSCLISESKVNTFENQTLKHVRLGKTWHLAVHKMREWESDNEKSKKNSKHYASVLVRDAEDNQRADEQYDQMNGGKKNKEVLIVLHQKTQNDITLRLSPAKQASSTEVPRLIIDEQEKDLSSKLATEVRSTESTKEVLARVYVVEGPQESSRPSLRVETDLGNLEVMYDGKSVQIRSNSLYRKNRGICGSFTGQRSNELKSPKNEIINNDKEFVASWALIEHESNTDNSLQKLQRKIEETSYPKEEVFYSNPVSNDKKSKKTNEKWNNDERKQASKKNVRMGTKHQTKYIEDYDNQRICFSKRPLPTCTPGTTANGKAVQNVEAYCRDINDEAAQQYKLKIQRGDHLDMSNYQANAVLKFTVPKRCE